MGREEQVEEREVLESIFPEEITDISETEFRILVTLDLVQQEEDDEPPSFLLQVRYPDDYPDKAPHLDLVAAPNAASHPNFSLSEDRDALLEALNTAAEENLGMAMVFALVSTVKEAAEQLIADREAAVEKVREEAARAAEQEENKKFHGTSVTPESFMKWREGFLREMEEQRLREEEERLAELKKARVKEPVKMTGRQLWEAGLVGKVEDDDDDMPVEGVEKLKVEAA